VDALLLSPLSSPPHHLQGRALGIWVVLEDQAIKPTLQHNHHIRHDGNVLSTWNIVGNAGLLGTQLFQGIGVKGNKLSHFVIVCQKDLAVRVQLKHSKLHGQRGKQQEPHSKRCHANAVVHHEHDVAQHVVDGEALHPGTVGSKPVAESL
jgi:hypothetical protein